LKRVAGPCRAAEIETDSFIASVFCKTTKKQNPTACFAGHALSPNCGKQEPKSWMDAATQQAGSVFYIHDMRKIIIKTWIARDAEA
jgi:hypothetical protein